LRNFHAKHFPQAPLPSAFSQTSPEEVVEEEDDGLGCYPDGVKRTLTDEQIAIFRHSEIEAILKERRLRKEAGLSSEVPSSPTSAAPVPVVFPFTDAPPGMQLASATPAIPATPTERDSSEDFQGEDSNSEQQSGSKKRRRKMSKKKRDAELKRNAKNRKTDRPSINYTENREAREMDEVKAEAYELDY